MPGHNEGRTDAAPCWLCSGHGIPTAYVRSIALFCLIVPCHWLFRPFMRRRWPMSIIERALPTLIPTPRLRHLHVVASRHGLRLLIRTTNRLSILPIVLSSHSLSPPISPWSFTYQPTVILPYTTLMRKYARTILLLAAPILCCLFPIRAAAQNQRAYGWCEQGGQTVVVGGQTAQLQWQQSYPFCTVTVYYSGTTNLATLYSDNNATPTPLSNPFTASQNGYWFFYAGEGRYDVTFSGASIGSPFTLGDISLTSTLNVRDFGATGNGTTDDNPAIQRAVNYACGLPNGGKIYAPAGTYVLDTAGIVFPTACNVEFYGDGPSTIFPVTANQTFLSPNPITMAGAGVFMCLSCSNVYVHDVAVIGVNTTIDGTDPTGGKQRAVSFGYDGSTPGPNNITVQRMRVNGMQSENIYVQSAFATKISFLNNYITNARFDALDLNYVANQGSEPYTGVDNLFLGNVVDGAANCVEGPADWTIITENRFLNCVFNGVILASDGHQANHALVSHNILRGLNNSLGVGLVVSSGGTTYTDNDISGFGFAGINITSGSSGIGGTNVLISNNQVHNNGTVSGGCNCDIQVNGAANVSIQGNSVFKEGTTGIGILVNASGAGADITNNIVCGAYTTPIQDTFSVASYLNNHCGNTGSSGAGYNLTPSGTFEVKNGNPNGTSLFYLTGSAVQGVNNYFIIRNNANANLLTFNYSGGSFLKLLDPSGTSLQIFSGNGFAGLGTFTNTPLLVDVNGAEVARFNTDGGLSIGATSDSGNKLLVNGNLFIEGNSLFQNTGGTFPTLVNIKGSVTPAQAGSPYLVLTNPSGNIIQQFYYKNAGSAIELDDPTSGNSLITGATNGVAFMNYGVSSILSFQQNGVEVGRFSSTGALLLGTTLNPTASELNVNGNVAATAYVAGTILGVTVTKTAGSCTIQVIGGIVTSITGC